MDKIKGVLWGILSGASFGLIPLFTIPLLRSGVTTDSILFYRFTIAASIIFVILTLRKESFSIAIRQIPQLIMLGLFYMASSLFLLWGYEFMAAGVATTIHFLYPVCVVLLMIIFFGERASIVNIGAVVVAIIGVAMLSNIDSEAANASMKGLIIVVISALAYALYIIGVRRTGLGSLGAFKLSFYVLSIAAIFFLIKAFVFGSGVTPLNNCSNIINITLLALIPTVASNFALVCAIKIVGSTTTSILGALEPMTAVVVGATLFDEPISFIIITGILLIIGAVTAVVLSMIPRR